MKRKPFQMLSPVTSVTTKQSLKGGWCSTIGWSTELQSWPQHQRLLNAQGRSQGLQEASLPPLCWKPTGRNMWRVRRSLRNVRMNLRCCRHISSVIIVITGSFGTNRILESHIQHKHKKWFHSFFNCSAMICKVTYRPVWPAVSAPIHIVMYVFLCVFTDVTKIKTTHSLNNLYHYMQ